MITEDELWKAIYDTIPQNIGVGEKTVGMVAEDKGVTLKTARKMLRRWEADGTIVSVGLRRIPRGNYVEAWRVVE